MLAKTPLKDLMIAWMLETKDPDEEYKWTDEWQCACAQFARDRGELLDWDTRHDSVNGREWAILDHEAYRAKDANGKRTFGALLERLRNG